MPTLVLNPFPIDIAKLPGLALGGVFVQGGFSVIKENL
jgi:hypothetical protein